jgi:uncharacterized protein (DUF488 family)
LENGLREADITYVFLGKELGARRTEEKSFVDGIASYDSIAGLPLFRAGLERLFRGMEQYRVALMCSEADPITCHRTILICHEIKKLRPHQSIIHILNDGNTETHEEAEQRLIAAHKLQPELFGELNSPEGLLDKAYALQAAKIAYHKGEEEP